MTTDERPVWQVEACPAWCVVLHGPDDPVRDREHVSASLAVPARQLLQGPRAVPSPFAEPDAPPPGTGAEGADRTATTDLAVALHRRDGGPVTWLYVGDGAEQVLDLTVESWSRLVPALDRALDRARA